MFFVPEKGFDIPAYFAGAMNFDHRFLCFLNSYSVLLDPQWLEKLLAVAMSDRVGAVGATGSWESHYSNALRWAVPGVKRSFLENVPRYLFRWLRGVTSYRRDFAPFPNVHLRTNAFMLRRDLMLNLKRGPLQRKMDTYRFESGKQGLTNQILEMNLRVLVVGRDGRAYEPDEWDASHTFRSGNQSNLLVDDNRTIEYVKADPVTKRLIEEMTWGHASPVFHE